MALHAVLYRYMCNGASPNVLQTGISRQTKHSFSRGVGFSSELMGSGCQADHLLTFSLLSACMNGVQWFRPCFGEHGLGCCG